MGPRPPVFTGAGSRREDNGGVELGVGMAGVGAGWVPAPRLHGGMISVGTTGGELVSQSNVTGDHKGRPYGGRTG